jgi:sugar/nucleoside kinase (ribokinase family)
VGRRALSGPGRIVVFGDVIDDIVVRPHGPIRPDTDTSASIRQRPGGSAANVAAWLGTLGAPVDFVGRVGADDLERHEAHLSRLGVRARLIADPGLPTGTIVVLIDENNCRTMLTERGANTRLIPADISDETLDGAAAVYFTGYSVFSGATNPDASPAAFQQLIARCARRGIPVVVDPSSSGYLEDFGAERFLGAIAGASVLLPNLDEGRVLTGFDDPIEVAARLAEAFPVVALTLGGQGTVVAGTGTAPVVVPVAAVARTDTTGAGDAFSAGFLVSWLGGASLEAAADAGALQAGRAIGVVGGRPA